MNIYLDSKYFLPEIKYFLPEFKYFSGLGPAGLPPFTPTPYETGDSFSALGSEPAYVTSAFVRDQKRTQKLPGDQDTG